MNPINWKDCVYYDETSPSFLRWKINRRNAIRRGDPVGTLVRGYWKLHSTNRSYNVHHIIWEFFHGPVPKGKRIDHKDHNRAHNWIWNLRLIKPELNARNRSKTKINRSGVTGVYQMGNGHGQRYWVSYWVKHGTRGVSGQRYFNIDKLGEREAFSLACAYRSQMIEEQNRLGAGYAETHGK